MLNSECTSAAAPEAEATAPAPTRAHHAKSPRFGVTLMVLLTTAFLLFVTELFGKSSSTTGRFVGTFVCVFATFFAAVWMRVHSFALSRKRHAWFDEANILETYQPRARTMGHLFQPDPPTPGAVKIAEPSDPEMHSDAEKAVFNANRDNHYANMFENAMRLNREMDAAQKSNVESPKPHVESPKPTTDSPKPSEESPKPSVDSSKASGEAPQLPTEAPKPPVEVPKPPVESPQSPASECQSPSAPRQEIGKKELDNNTDLSSENNKPGAAPFIDDNTLRGVSEIRSINLLPMLEMPEEKKPRKKKSDSNIKSPKSPSGRKSKSKKRKEPS